MTAIAAPAAARRRLGRRQTLGVLFGAVGIYLVGYVAAHLDAASKGLTFEPPPDPLRIGFTPGPVVAGIGTVFLITAVATFFDRQRPGLARALLTTSTVLCLPLVLVVALALSEAPDTNVLQLLVESLRLGTPVALGAMAGLWCERSGVVNIGIEGMMLASAAVGFMVYALVGDASSTSALWLAVGAAVLTGGLVALLHAVLSVSFRVDQIISGVVINLLALGATGFIRSEVIVPSGFTTGRNTSPIGIPLLSDIPIVGEQLFTNRPIFFAMFAIVALTAFVLNRTPFGLRVRACGEHPHAAETLGIDVIRTRYRAVVIGGLIAGVAGAWFSLEAQGGFEDRMTNGAGFIALAALIFGRWRPSTAFAGAILFGFTRALGSRLQFLGVHVSDFSIPSEFWQSLPFVVTVVVVAGVVGRAAAPAAVGVPYERSR
ncbi:MAG: ABC transporter permease [Actinomycetota bacterium]|nr:ABC transporter permease [Actinomycetota bacterium]